MVGIGWDMPTLLARNPELIARARLDPVLEKASAQAFVFRLPYAATSPHGNGISRPARFASVAGSKARPSEQVWRIDYPGDAVPGPAPLRPAVVAERRLLLAVAEIRGGQDERS